MGALILLLFFFGIPAALMFYYYRKYKFQYVNELLVLIAHVAGADNSLSTIENKYINHILFKRYGKRRQERYFNRILFYLKSKTKINNSIAKLNSRANGLKKLQILHVLVKVATIDGYLTESELHALSNIATELKLKYFQLDSLLAMCNFTSERTERKKKQYKKQSKVNTQSKEKLALTILELEEGATSQEIKKAYRKLVAIHHPDKVLHQNKVMQKIAKEEFLKISEAYELLKTNKGFK